RRLFLEHDLDVRNDDRVFLRLFGRKLGLAPLGDGAALLRHLGGGGGGQDRSQGQGGQKRRKGDEGGQGQAHGRTVDALSAPRKRPHRSLVRYWRHMFG